MKARLINCILVIVVIILALNLVVPFNAIFGKVVFSNVGCEINGAYVDDANLCCHELGRFQNCENGECSSKNYRVSADKKTLNYCKISGYDVRTK